ncbi:MAG: methyltransferase domain-containing protein [Methylophaga sp.]|nr:methyltransferase domain-containing protein [Methylophaga sp.]
MTVPESKWDKIYSQKSELPKASLVLTNNLHLLPKHGVALDLACGQGGNALLLAEAGLDVWAWDASSVAIDQLREFAATRSLSVDAQVRDVVKLPPKENSVDVLVVSFFLDRDLCPLLLKALRPGGILFYQTYCQEKVADFGPRNPDFLLTDNELLKLFSPMNIRVYREEALLGDPLQGWRNQALLVAEK